MPDGHPTLLVGTTKGAFLMVGKVDRDDRAANAPFCDGWPINHVVDDPETSRLWAGGGGDWNGAGVWRSGNAGDTWRVVRLTRGVVGDWATTDADFARMIGYGWRGSIGRSKGRGCADGQPFANRQSCSWRARLRLEVERATRIGSMSSLVEPSRAEQSAGNQPWS